MHQTTVNADVFGHQRAHVDGFFAGVGNLYADRRLVDVGNLHTAPGSQQDFALGGVNQPRVLHTRGHQQYLAAHGRADVAFVFNGSCAARLCVAKLQLAV